jgi:hypothetical protein
MPHSLQKATINYVNMAQIKLNLHLAQNMIIQKRRMCVSLNL